MCDRNRSNRRTYTAKNGVHQVHEEPKSNVEDELGHGGHDDNSIDHRTKEETTRDGRRVPKAKEEHGGDPARKTKEPRRGIDESCCRR